MLLIVISFSCGKDDDAVPTSGSNIAEPENIDDPAILPATYTEIEKLEGGFTPMLTGVIANWRVLTRIKYRPYFMMIAGQFGRKNFTMQKPVIM